VICGVVVGVERVGSGVPRSASLSDYATSRGWLHVLL
jgi:hypothetical protein